MDQNMQLTENEKNVLLGLAQKGATASASAISKMINKHVKLGVKEVSYLEVEKIGGTILDSETVVTTLYLRITGDVAGSMVLVFPNECAFFLVDLLSQKNDDKRKTKFTEYEKSILKEISNIVSGSFLKSLSDYLGLSLVESIPDMTTDMAQAAMDSILIDFAHSAHKAITINIEIASNEEKIRGSFFLLFDSASADIILKSLKGKIGNEQ